ncbi:LPS translocon maturation chaperone LptM [Psychrobacter sp. Marseille-P5312]|uniref:LPS translocon maturation chaperone LptM n=1 Tax=Psychrobacter sp. Marseille-P5312 TaxID=2086574 RepID=UPI001D0D09BF|nr:lipoprotein [Psychrobacter sp. Marseille-P5312]
MLFIRHSTHLQNATSAVAHRRVSLTSMKPVLIMSAVSLLVLSGCGQKGGLYLVDDSRQTVQQSTETIDSTSHPQDTAFAGIDDDKHQPRDDWQLPAPSTDPNDY